MRRSAAFMSIAFLCLAICAQAHTLMTTFSGLPLTWSVMPVPFWISQAGSPQIINGSEFEAVRAAFRTWQQVPLANISFRYMGTTPVNTVSQDGLSLVTFADNTLPLGSDIVSATFLFYEKDSAGASIQEADIALNPSLEWSTSGEVEKWDIQGILTHEIGHLLGLGESGLMSSVMVPFSPPGRVDQRKLTYDDMAGVAGLYPRASAAGALGGIAGIVSKDSLPVAGAHVVAMDVAGTPLVSTLSQPDGSYQINFLPAGSYRIYAEPLDGPLTEASFTVSARSFFRQLRKDFSTTYYGDVSDLNQARSSQVSAGQRSAGVDIHVLPPSSLNLTGPIGLAPQIPLRGQATVAVEGIGIASDVSFSASHPGISLGEPAFGGSVTANAPARALIGVTISANTALGPKNLAVSGGGASSILSGGLIIANPAPANIQVFPATGRSVGGAAVTVTGRNFRPGAQVYFGGLAGTNVQVINSETIQATTPPNIAGRMNVLVVNDDGTWGVQSGAFSYVGQLPEIYRILPSSGPPTTVVTIRGAAFDSRIQNLEVLFNGMPAKILTATPTSIEAVVPYHATTGPVAVTVLDKYVVGPVFTVTAAPASANRAPGSYSYADAALGTPLSFSNNNDAVGLVDLPFTFSLFDNVYVAGSKVAICTNGWLSLDAVTDPEYQNGPLPGATVKRLDGGVASIPPALIAPFFDDLYIRSGLFSSSNRSVTVQTLGTAPNRQFVIAWWDMAILDEKDRDIGARLTFEAILFEGSNDIQFIYKSLSGPRSDGSRATVGIQDSTRTKGIQSGYDQAILSSGFAITYHFINGTYTGEISVTDRWYNVVDAGGTYFATDGSDSRAVNGYAAIQPDSASTTPTGAAILSSRVNGIMVSETSVSASAPLLQARIYAEMSEQVGTGVAIVNPNAKPATVAFRLTDSGGVDSGSGSIWVPAAGQFSGFLDQAPFNGSSRFQGTLSIISDRPVSVAAFRGLINERGEFLTTAMPVVDPTVAPGTNAVILPHFSDGGGWSSQVLLVNPSDATLSGQIKFFDAAGQAVTLTANGQTQNSFTYSVAAGSSFKLRTDGSSKSMSMGWIQVVPDSSGYSPLSMAILSFKSAGVTVTEYGATAFSGTSFRAFVETFGTPGAVGSIQSGVVLVNASTSSTDVSLDLTGLDGSSLGINASLTIPGNGRVAKSLNDVFKAQTLPQRGILSITSSSGTSLTVACIRSRYNERGDLLTTAIPISDTAATAGSTALIIPYFANGNGSSVQFLLFSGSTGQAGAGILRFIRPDGTPLPLPLK